MKKIGFVFLSGLCLLLSCLVHSTPTVTLIAPSIQTTYAAGSSTTLTYYLNNYVPKPIPIQSISGISPPLSITSPCTTIPAGTLTHPGVCTITITIAPTTGDANTRVRQQLQINTASRTPLISPINFQVTNMSHFAYVSTALNGTLYACAQGTNGSLTTCRPMPSTSPSWFPTSTYFATFNDTRYAYISSYYSDVYQCTVNEDASLDPCIIANPTTPPYYSVVTKNVTISTVNETQYAYVAQADTGPGTDVWLCQINQTTGIFTNCQTTGDDYHWSNVFDVTVESFDNQYAYVTDNNSSKIVRCTINQTDGTFLAGSCIDMTPSGTPWISPSAVTFASFNGTKYAYISDQNGEILQCALNQTTGEFVSCISNVYSGGQNVFGVAFSTIESTTYAYISILSGQVWTCAVNNLTGEFFACAEQFPTFSDDLSFGNVFWVAFNE